jgi:DNA ligase (NAD+)
LQFVAEQKSTLSDSLAGLTFVISGSFANHSRDELKAMIEAHGGKNLAAVSSNTNFLLAGDKIGPAKLQKATKLGVKIISEQEFMEMVGDAETAPAETPKAEEKNTIQTPIQGSLF